MALSSYFIALLAYTKAVPRQADPDPAQVYDQLQELISQARERALSDEVVLDRFHEALFPVVAWIDERLSLLPAWRDKAAWRAHMLQRKLFHTSLAGVQFFDRMEAIDETDNELREVFLTCLGLGFVGKYSQTPNSPALMQFKQSQYALMRSVTDGVDHEETLFSPAYQTVAQAAGGRRKLGPKSKLALVIFVPLAVLLALVFWFDQLLAQNVSEIVERLP